MAETRRIVVGTRGSALALAQTESVCAALRRARPGIDIRVERIRTTGDVSGDVPLAELGRGVFVTEIETALRAGRIDLAVHSAKDLPSTLAPDLTLAAILPREDARDVLVSPYRTARALPPGARVGTSSPRRASLLRALRPDVETVEVRGNVDTRLRKLAAGELDGLVLAAAGLIRLGRQSEATEWLDPDEFVPSVGQGALAVETRADDAWTVELVRPLDDRLTHAAVVAERAFLAELGAGCRAAAGAHARSEGGGGAQLRIVAFIGDARGARVRASRTGTLSRARELGVGVAHELLRAGGARFLARGSSALAGKTVAVTRPEEQARELVALLCAHGARPIVCPTIAIELVAPLPELDALFGAHSPSWIVFTSANAMAAVADHLERCGRALPGTIRLAAIGEKTALVLASRLRAADFIPSAANAETLAAELPDVAGATVVFPRGDLAAETLADGLTARGATVREVVVYRTTSGPGVDDLIARARGRQLDAVVFASPSSVRYAAQAVGALLDADDRPVVVCIGATTARAARELGLDPIESASQSVGALVETLERAFATPPQQTLSAAMTTTSASS